MSFKWDHVACPLASVTAFAPENNDQLCPRTWAAWGWKIKDETKGRNYAKQLSGRREARRLASTAPSRAPTVAHHEAPSAGPCSPPSPLQTPPKGEFTLARILLPRT